MALNHSPKIVTNGLVLCLDAGNTRSYPGSGTTWTDLSGSNNNATLVGSPTFTSDYFTLNGSSQYFTLATTPLTSVTTCTMLMWIFNAAAQSASAGLFFNRSGTNTCGMNFQFNNPTRLGWHWNDNAATYTYDTGLTIPQGSWSMVAVSVGATSTTHWVNTSSNTQSFTTVAQTFNSVTIGIDPTSIRYFNGRIGVVNLYNRALSATEITQNFNALKGRFGL